SSERHIGQVDVDTRLTGARNRPPALAFPTNFEDDVATRHTPFPGHGKGAISTFGGKESQVARFSGHFRPLTIFDLDYECASSRRRRYENLKRPTFGASMSMHHPRVDFDSFDHGSSCVEQRHDDLGSRQQLDSTRIDELRRTE
ncbi:MAG: hypothetical protein ACKPBG_09230, partial [Actinomycetota bacterium]